MKSNFLTERGCGPFRPHSLKGETNFATFLFLKGCTLEVIESLTHMQRENVISILMHIHAHLVSLKHGTLTFISSLGWLIACIHVFHL